MVKNIPANAGDARFDPCVEKVPWKRKWQPTLVFLPAKSHGQRSLAGKSPWGPKRVRYDLTTKQEQGPLILGHVCAGPQKLQGNPRIPMDLEITWVD